MAMKTDEFGIPVIELAIPRKIFWTNWMRLTSDGRNDGSWLFEVRMMIRAGIAPHQQCDSDLRDSGQFVAEDERSTNGVENSKLFVRKLNGKTSGSSSEFSNAMYNCIADSKPYVERESCGIRRIGRSIAMDDTRCAACGFSRSSASAQNVVIRFEFNSWMRISVNV